MLKSRLISTTTTKISQRGRLAQLGHHSTLYKNTCHFHNFPFDKNIRHFHNNSRFSKNFLFNSSVSKNSLPNHFHPKESFVSPLSRLAPNPPLVYLKTPRRHYRSRPWEDAEENIKSNNNNNNKINKYSNSTSQSSNYSKYDQNSPKYDQNSYNNNTTRGNRSNNDWENDNTPITYSNPNPENGGKVKNLRYVDDNSAKITNTRHEFHNDAELNALQAQLEQYRVQHDLNAPMEAGIAAEVVERGGGDRYGTGRLMSNLGNNHHHTNTYPNPSPNGPKSSHSDSTNTKTNNNIADSNGDAQSSYFYSASRTNESQQQQHGKRSRFDQEPIYHQNVPKSSSNPRSTNKSSKYDYDEQYNKPIDPLLQYYKDKSRDYKLNTLAGERPSLYREFLSPDSNNPIILNKAQQKEISNYGKFPRYQAMLANQHTIVQKNFLESHTGVHDLYKQVQKGENTGLEASIRNDPALMRERLLNNEIVTEIDMSLKRKLPENIESFDKFKDVVPASRAGLSESHQKYLDKHMPGGGVLKSSQQSGHGAGQQQQNRNGQGDAQISNSSLNNSSRNSSQNLINGSQNFSQNLVKGSQNSNSKGMEPGRPSPKSTPKQTLQEFTEQHKDLPSLDKLFAEFNTRMKG